MREIKCNALLFADKAIEEKSGKKGLIGIFNTFYIQSFPSSVAPWAIFLSLTNLEGEFEFSLNFVRDDSNEVILSIGGEIESKDPNADIELIFPIQNIMFRKPGTHTMTVNLDGKQVASKVLKVFQKEERGK